MWGHSFRDRGATLRLGGGGGDMTEFGGGTIHFFSLTLYNFINIGGGGGARAPLTPTPRSLSFQTFSHCNNKNNIDRSFNSHPLPSCYPFKTTVA